MTSLVKNRFDSKNLTGYEHVVSVVNPKSMERREKLRRGVEEIGMSLFLEVQPAKRQEYFNSQQTKSQNKQSSSPFTNPWPNAIQIKDFFYFNSVIDVSQLDMPVDLLLQDDIMDKDPLPDVHERSLTKCQCL